MEKEKQQLYNFMQNIVSLNEEDIKELFFHVELKTYKKKEVILDLEDKCKGVYFVIEGLFRIYFIRDGVEVTINFFKENDFFADYESLITDFPMRTVMQSIEPIKLLFIPYDKLTEAYERSHSLEKFGRLMIEKAFVSFLTKINNMSNLKSEQKYLMFEEMNKGLSNRIPLKYLASFFGITPESLSRIRKSRIQNIS